MRSYHDQRLRDGARAIILYTAYFDDAYYAKNSFFKNVKEMKAMTEEACRNAWDGCQVEWHPCRPEFENFDQYDFRWANIRVHRRQHRLQLESIRKIMSQLNVRPEDIKEVWHASCGVYSYVLHLYPKAKAVFFEHGTSDVRLTSEVGKVQKKGMAGIRSCLGRTKRFLLSCLIRFLLLCDHQYRRTDIHVSLLADEIRAGNESVHVQGLDPQKTLQLGAAYVEKSCRDLFSRLEGPTAVVLMTYFFMPRKTAEDDLRPQAAFEKYLSDNQQLLFRPFGIKNIVFKNIFWSDQVTRETFEAFEKNGSLSGKYHLIYLQDHSPHNYPLECYLDVIRPRVLCSADCSSALFYAKKMVPGLHTFSSYDWFMDYCRKNSFTINHDYYWMTDFWWGHPEFKDLLPVRLGV
jgi:hypothetical protein